MTRFFDESVWKVEEKDVCYDRPTCAHFAPELKGKGRALLRAAIRERGKRRGR